MKTTNYVFEDPFGGDDVEKKHIRPKKRSAKVVLQSIDRSSESSTASDGSSSGKLYMSLDERVGQGVDSASCGTDSDGIAAEETLLLSWPQTKKVYSKHNSPRPLLLKQKTLGDSSSNHTLSSELIL